MLDSLAVDVSYSVHRCREEFGRHLRYWHQYCRCNLLVSIFSCSARTGARENSTMRLVHVSNHLAEDVITVCKRNWRTAIGPYTTAWVVCNVAPCRAATKIDYQCLSVKSPICV